MMLELIAAVMMVSTSAGAPATADVRYLATMSDVNRALGVVDLALILDDTPDWNAAYLQPFATHLEYQVLGAGETAQIDVEALVRFSRKWIADGNPAKTIGPALTRAYLEGELAGVDVDTEQKAASVTVGGFFVTEFEYHQEPDGKYLRLLEINQMRIFFSADVTPGVPRDRVTFLAEWNPVSEEVIHQIDEATFDVDGAPMPLVPVVPEIEGLVPFERAYIGIANVVGSGVDLEIGQFRNPFGIWSDYTSHRNFSAAKNNVLVNGFALKKIELGVSAYRKLPAGFDLRAAVVHGRLGRTSPLDRADRDDTKDMVGRLGWSSGIVQVGTSAYFADGSTKNVAAGVDWRATLGRVLLSGEAVWQRNDDPSKTYETALPIDRLEAQSAYLQANVSLTPRISVYGFYEVWRMLADDEPVYDPTIKAYQGVRVLVHPHVRWTVLEIGWNDHDDFDKGRLHSSTQLELQF